MIKKYLYKLLKFKPSKKTILSAVFVTFGFLVSFIYFLPSGYVYNQIYTPLLEVETREQIFDDIYINQNSNQFLPSLIADINSAKARIDVLMFSIDHPLVFESLKQAVDRGVEVKIVTDNSKVDTLDMYVNDFRIITPNDDLDMSKRMFYMHHKLVLIDNHTVYFGSNNITNFQLEIDNGYMIKSTNSDLITSLIPELDTVLSGKSSFEKLERLYNPFLSKITTLDSNEYLSIWRNPGLKNLNVKNEILKMIASAKSDIDLLMWFFSDDQILSSLEKKLAQGVTVNLFWDAFAAKSDEVFLEDVLTLEKKYPNLNLSLIETKDKFGNLSYFHFHVMIVDSREIIFGTNNWSTNGFYFNDELIMFSNQKALIDRFKEVILFN